MCDPNVLKGLIHKSINKDTNTFDGLMQEIETYIEHGTATTMAELKEKANRTKKKGDLFESFCFLYLKHVLQHDDVWFYKDFPMDLKTVFHLPKQDYGIDLISKKGEGYYAIQCKYRRPQEKIQTIPWKSLSTFYAMVVKSGPWVKHITMTNVNGCRHIGEKTEKDWSICIGTFRKMDHFTWLKLCGHPIELTTPIEMPDKNILRNLRLAHFGSPPVDEKIDT